VRIETTPLTPARAWVLDLLRARLHDRETLPTSLDPAQGEEAVAYAVEQRVALLLYDFLKRRPDLSPPACLAELKRLYRTGTIRAVQQECELAALQKIFNAAELPFMPLKGLLLSRYLYADPALRPCVDIDLLVPSAQMTRAAALLRERGYRFLAHWNPRRDRFRRRVSNHWELFHPERRMVLELHHQLVSRSCSADLETAGLWPRAQAVELNGRNYQFMSPEDLLLYLAVHSAKENWASLLQVYDIALLLSSRFHLDWAAVLARAEEWHCTRRLAIGCALAAELFQVALPDPLPAAAGRSVSFTADARHRLLTPGPRLQLSRWQEAWNDLALAERWRDRLSILAWKSLNQLAGVTALLPEGAEPAPELEGSG